MEKVLVIHNDYDTIIIYNHVIHYEPHKDQIKFNPNKYKIK